MTSHRGKRINCVCRNCKTPFTDTPSRIKMGKGQFCSLSCYKTYRKRRIVVVGMVKECSTCRVRKNVKYFTPRKDTRDRLTTQCSDCRKITVIACKYKTSRPEAEKLFYHQKNGYCDSCGLSAEDHRKLYGSSLHIDHDHENGMIRGVLCHKCNVTLGNFKDSIGELELLIEYIKRTSHEK